MTPNLANEPTCVNRALETSLIGRGTHRGDQAALSIHPSRSLQITSTWKVVVQNTGPFCDSASRGTGLKKDLFYMQEEGKERVEERKGPQSEEPPQLDQGITGSLSPWQRAPQHAMSDKKPLKGAHFFRGKM